jgi:hypothetical protein
LKVDRLNPIAILLNDEEEKPMTTTRQTLVEITHPLFWKGYQEGRQRYFQQQYMLTDKDLVRCLGFPFRRSKRKSAKEREKDLHSSIGRLVGEMSGCVLPRQPHEEDTGDLQEKPPSSLQQLLVEITHPLFWKGYQEGRQRYFQEQIVLTDVALVAGLSFAFLPRKHKSAEEIKEDLYYSIGQLVGEMHGCVLPLQPHEERTRALQEAFLARVMPQYEGAGKTLVKIIRQFWIVQDQLAQTLDAESFEEMVNCCAEKGNPLAVVEA